MGIRLVWGRAGRGKTRAFQGEIGGELRRDPRGFPLVYLVPEQATFQAEYSLVTLPGVKGMTRCQVLSFPRLAYRVREEVGGGRGVYIDDTGKSMVLRRVLERCRKDLQVLKYSGREVGLLEGILDIYTGLKRSRAPVPEMARALAGGAGEDDPDGPVLLKAKLRDLELILGELDRELSRSPYLDAGDLLDLLAEKVPGSSFLGEARVWVDGFFTFTGQELAVLGELGARCPQVSVALCLDREVSLDSKLDRLDPFFPGALACRELKKVAVSRGIPLEVIQLPAPPRSRFLRGSRLEHLERYCHRYPARAYGGGRPGEGTRDCPGPAQLPGEKGWGVQLVAAPHPRAEVESLARELTRLARDQGRRWRDLLVLVGNLEGYRETITTVFNSYDIPYFLDQKQAVLHHPLVEFIRSALEVVTGYFSLEAVFRCVKTDLLFPFPGEGEGGLEAWRDRGARLENYCLAFGLRGTAWLEEGDWEYRERDDLEEGLSGPGGGSPREGAGEDPYRLFLEEVNGTRRALVAPLLSFYGEIKGATRVKDKTLALYRLLEGVQAGRRLELWQQECLERGETARAREHSQVYELVLDLLDQLVEISGEEKVSRALYGRLLETGLENLRLGLVPPALDQVLVGTPGRTRPGPVSHAFLLGVNEGMFPAPVPEDRLFNPREREQLTDAGLGPSPGQGRDLLDHQYLEYQALTRASRGIRVSYSLADQEGRGLMPSLLVSRLQEMFPGLPEEIHYGEPGEGAGEGEVLSYLVHPRRSLSRLAVQLGSWKKGKEMSPAWWEAYNWYARRQEWHETGRRLLGGVFYNNQEPPLSPETSRRLYGVKLRAGVHRLEKFSACPFSQFVSYGLGLQERSRYRLDTAGMGRFFHVTLYQVSRSLEEDGLAWGSLTQEETSRRVDEVVDRLVPRLQKEILLSSNRYRYLGKKLKETVGQAAWHLNRQASLSRFMPVGLEVSFGPGGDFSAVNIQLSGGQQLELVGRIDRLDAAEGGEGQRYLRVIDYKSGDLSLPLGDIYHRLSLQMLAYLYAALQGLPREKGEEVRPAGVLYFRVHSPLLKSPGPLSLEEAREKMQKEFQMKGLVLGDIGVVKLMDTSLEKGYSQVIPAGITVKGAFYKNSRVLEPAHFQKLLDYVEQALGDLASRILGGEVGLSPYRLGQRRACTYCQYRPVCQFDPLVEGSSYRSLPRLDDQEVISRLGLPDNGREGGPS